MNSKEEYSEFRVFSCASVVKKLAPLELIRNVLSPSTTDLNEWKLYLSDDSFYQFMGREGLVGLVYHRFHQGMNEKILSRWRQGYLSTASYNILLLNELIELYKVFQKEQIEPILLKGTALFFSIYRESLGIRPVCDVDMHVQSGHLEQLKLCLNHFQFVQSINYPTTFTKNLLSENLIVDIHTELINIDRVSSRKYLPIQISDISKQKIIFENAVFWVPQDEDHFVYLSAHLVLHHGMERALWLWDLIQISNSKHFNWDKALERTMEWHVEKIMYFTLLKLQLVAPENVPEHILKQLQPQKYAWMEKKCWDMAVSHSYIPNIRYALTFFLFDHLKYKLVYLRELLLPASDGLKAFLNSRQNTSLIGIIISYLQLWVKIMGWSLRWIRAVLVKQCFDK